MPFRGDILPLIEYRRLLREARARWGVLSVAQARRLCAAAEADWLARQDRRSA